MMNLKLPERRRFLRVEVPLKTVITDGDRTVEVVTKNISAVGLGFEAPQELIETGKLKISVQLPESEAPVRITGKVVRQRKISLEDNAPYDVGVEIIGVEDSQKNIFLKYFCDLLYNASYSGRT